MNIVIKWEKGHPEREQPDRSKWSVTQVFNDQADSLAKQMWTQDPQSNVYPKWSNPMLPSTNWYITTPIILTSNVKNSIIDLIETNLYKKHFHKHWPHADINFFHWEALRRITSSINTISLRGHLKCVHQQWATLDILEN